MKILAGPLLRMATVVLALLGSVALLACGPGTSPAPEVTAPPAAKSAPEAAAWQQKWESTLAEARKEGNLTVLTAASSEARQEITKAFKELTGITTEWVAGRPAELVTKLERERVAGIYSTDVYYGSPEPALIIFKSRGMIAPFPPMLLPEVASPQGWYGGKMPFLDKDNTALAAALYPFAPLLVNTDLVKSGEVKSYQDLLSPRWKGKVAMNDPSVGVGGGWFHGVMYAKILTPEFMRALAKQDPAITRDFALATEWLARGKYPVLTAPQMTITAEFMDKGAPIGHVIPSEGVFLWSAMGTISAFDRAPHPKATQVFVNWFLSKEGQKLISKVNQIDSSRVDIDTGFLPGFLRRQQGVKYYVDTDNEEALKARPDNDKLSREIFGIK
ncbi:MAG: extracellular solute-binding protein [Chloroflexi bacterium]|nr:extracellular solute-binding protein [Chloroflexota bacterium]